MSRSKWKGPYIKIRDLKSIKKNKPYLISRNSDITPNLLGLDFKVYNGKNFIELTVNDNMIGHKFGEFVSTRTKFLFKKKKSKK
jgi:small subunit ribosomal protein S19